MPNNIHPTAIIYPGTHIGRNNVIGPHCVIGYPGAIREAEDFGGTCTIGSNNTFGVGVVVCVGTEGETRIGSNNIVMNRVNVGHNAEIENNTEIGAGTVIGGWARICEAARIKIHATIRNRVTVGSKSVVGMGSNVVCDVPPDTTVYGNPAR